MATESPTPLTVEEAQTEMRKMCPTAYYDIAMSASNDGVKWTIRIASTEDWKHFYSNTLADCISQVREWKSKQ